MAKADKKLGKRVKEFRLDRLMTRAQAAQLFGVSLRTFARIEAGQGCNDLNRARVEKALAAQSSQVAA